MGASSAPRESGAKSNFQAVLEVTESIAVHRDMPALFHDLIERLPHLVRFDALWLVLHEPSRNVMRLYIVEAPGRADVDVVERPLADSPSGWVWEHQQPLVVTDMAREQRFSEAFDLLQAYGVKSSCILPLTTAHRRLGAVGSGSQQVAAYDASEVEFLLIVARQVAVAVDNALNHQAAQSLQEQLQHERDRLKLLLDLNNSVVSILDLRQLFRAISASVRKVMACDYARILLPEAGGEQLRVYARDFSAGGDSWEEEIVVPATGRPAGDVLKSGEPLILDRDGMSRYGTHLNLWRMGLRSLCVLPMVSRGRIIGTLNLGGLRDSAFSENDIDFLLQVVKQIAIGVENALNYEQIFVAGNASRKSAIT